jgi:hypothetical protein
MPFNISVDDHQLFASLTYDDELKKDMQAAAAEWAPYLGYDNSVTVNVEINVVSSLDIDPVTGRAPVASAHDRAWMIVGQDGSLKEWMPRALYKETYGLLSSDSSPDFIVNVSASTVENSFIGHPAYATSVFAHEIGHGLGFYSFRNQSTGQLTGRESVWDALLQLTPNGTNAPTATFDGSFAEYVYSDPVPVTLVGGVNKAVTSYDHLGILFDLMYSGYSDSEAAQTVSTLDGAIINDLTLTPYRVTGSFNFGGNAFDSEGHWLYVYGTMTVGWQYSVPFDQRVPPPSTVNGRQIVLKFSWSSVSGDSGFGTPYTDGSNGSYTAKTSSYSDFLTNSTSFNGVTPPYDQEGLVGQRSTNYGSYYITKVSVALSNFSWQYGTLPFSSNVLSGQFKITAQGNDGTITTIPQNVAFRNTPLQASLSAAPFFQATPATTVSHDFKNAGTSDILFRNDSTGDTWFEATSNGASTWNHIGGSNTSYAVVGTGDFYGDGTCAILYRNNSTGDTWFAAMSDGAFPGWNQVGGSDTHYSVVGVGDFYGTGTSDILYRNNSTGDTWFEAMNDGSFAGWYQIGGSDTHYSVLGVADVNGNVTDDIGNVTNEILFRNNSTGDTWFEAISNAAFAGWNHIGGSDTHYSVVGMGDFFGNGSADDILFRNASTGDTWFETMNNGSFAGWYQIGGSDTHYSVVGIGDFFGTGTDGIFFRNNSTGDTWFEAISNGAFAGWNHIGGSNTSYTVPDTGASPTSPPPPPPPPPPTATTTYTYDGPAFKFTYRGGPSGAGSNLTCSVTFDFDTSNATGWYGSPATIGAQYLTGLISNSIAALSVQSGSYAGTLYSDGALSPGYTLSQGGPDFHFQNGVIDQWFVNFETPSGATFLTEHWPVYTEDSLFVGSPTGSYGTGETGNLGAWTKQ